MPMFIASLKGHCNVISCIHYINTYVSSEVPKPIIMKLPQSRNLSIKNDSIILLQNNKSLQECLNSVALENNNLTAFDLQYWKILATLCYWTYGYSLLDIYILCHVMSRHIANTDTDHWYSSSLDA